MKDGFIKVAAATPSIRVADCKYNGEQMASMMRDASAKGTALLVFPELSITGYTCGDLFLQEPLLRGAEQAILHLCEASRELDMAIIAGAPVQAFGKLFNCAVVILRGQILGIAPKSNLPNYAEFYERRHFEPGHEDNTRIFYAGQEVPFGTKLLFACSQLPEFIFAVEVCEDLWIPDPVSTHHALAGATVIANCSASDETIGKDGYRRQLIQAQSARLICGYIYCDAGDGESTTDMVFAGHNLIGENGVLLAQSKAFQNGILYSELDVKRLASERRRMTTYPYAKSEGYTTVPFSLQLRQTEITRTIEKRPFVPENKQDRSTRCESIVTMQAAGLRKRIEHTNCRSLVVGISGGLDSCLALLVAVRAMDWLKRDRKDIIAVTMPCFGTTQRTKGNAEQLSEKLGVTLRCIDIAESVQLHFQDIGQDPHRQDVVYENSQARERTQILMDIANQHGGLVVGTGDLSELALGWATYNGDHMSMYGVNASIPKTLIRHIVQYVADTADDTSLRQVLEDILDTPVSPELLPAKDGEIAQKTEHIVGPYELHDFFLYYMMRWGFAPSKIFRIAEYAFGGEYSSKTIANWMAVFYRRFFAQQFKRSCLPDGPKVGSVTLSPRGDWRMPSDASARLWLEEAQEILANC